MKKISPQFKIYTAFLAFAIPLISFAEQNTRTLGDIVKTLALLAKSAAEVVGALFVLAFIWGIARFILNAGNSEQRTEDKLYLFWVVVALFVAFSVWGFVAILQQTLLVS
jgi:hypothetical protein